jgi:AAA15 family ATPase/GTPase
MRIDKVHIVDYKNLKDFKIDLDHTKMETILLGQNATGKSNFIEAIVLIFKHLDLKTKPPFEYTIDYTIKGNGIRASYNGKRYDFVRYEPTEMTIKGQEGKLKMVRPLSNKDFFDSKDDHLPKYVFTYYSGISNKLKSHFDDHQKKFYDKAKKGGVSKDDVEDLRRLFYVQLVHSYFVLLAYFSTQEQEDSSKQFLSEVLGIMDLESILFALNKPRWKGKGDPRFWGAKGLVEEFLKKLWDNSLAPIRNEERVPIDFRRDAKMEFLYLFVKGKKELRNLASFYNSNTDFFKALESTYISDLIHEVRVKVKKKDVDGNVTFKELSEGEQQLLTVLGLLKFTKDDESLILLDEPDTHLNPSWKWKYREYLKDVVGREKEDQETTQIILNTHDPLVIGSLVKEEVRIFKHDPESKKTIAIEPDIDPKGLGVAGILTSELFGLPTILDKETQEKLNRKRYLQGIIQREDAELSPMELQEYHALKAEMEKLGFYEEVEDVWFKMYLSEMSRFDVVQKVEYSTEEKQLLERESKKAVQRVLEKLEKNRN